MKSEKKSRRKQKTEIEGFWSWFGQFAGVLASNVENTALLKELDARVHGLDPQLSWEIGPGLTKPWQLVISPNLDQDLRKTTQKIVAIAPVLEAWEFHPARQPKKWDYRLELGSSRLAIDASQWTFVLLRYPNANYEVLLKGKALPPLNEDERWQAAAITLESILGEDTVLDRVDEFALVDELEPRFSERERPIQALREALGVPTK
jgi:hypothetical protein